eukprot:Opistho-1_new@26302
MYWLINLAFIPTNATGKASVIKSFSISTASLMIACTASCESLFSSMLYNKQANSQCAPSSLEINSLLNVNPGIKPRFLSQKIEQKLPLKKIPSTAAKATNRSAKVPFSIQRKAHSAFLFTAGTVSMAWNKRSFSSGS